MLPGYGGTSSFHTNRETDLICVNDPTEEAGSSVNGEGTAVFIHSVGAKKQASQESGRSNKVSFSNPLTAAHVTLAPSDTLRLVQTLQRHLTELDSGGH